jgi:hypothetical protein
MPFSVVVTSTEHYWVTLAKRRRADSSEVEVSEDMVALFVCQLDHAMHCPLPIHLPWYYNSHVIVWLVTY